MTQQYRIKVTNGTASYYFEKGKVYPTQMLAFSAAGVVYYSYKWLYGDNHGIKTVVEPYEPEPLGFTASEIKAASETIAKVLHRNNPIL